MIEVKGITSLSYGDIACNAALVGVLYYNTNFHNNGEVLAFIITSFGLVISMLYALQLILIKRNHYRHVVISGSARVLLHICRIIQLLYSLAGAYLLSATVYFSLRRSGFMSGYGGYDYKFLAALALILVTVVVNLTIFFKGWRLLKLVRTNYIDQVMETFD